LEECYEKIFTSEFKNEVLEDCVHKILSQVEIQPHKEKNFIIYKGYKVGYLIKKVPLEEIKVHRFWKGPFGIKLELSYLNNFIGVLVIRK
jgi:hypothetical protein